MIPAVQHLNTRPTQPNPPEPPVDLHTAETATLIIGRSNSRCGNCGDDVLPQSTHHVDVSGWTPGPGEGCGARFVAMRSDSWGVTAADLKSIRPDLPVEPTPNVTEERQA